MQRDEPEGVSQGTLQLEQLALQQCNELTTDQATDQRSLTAAAAANEGQHIMAALL